MNRFFYILITACLFMFTSCGKDDDEKGTSSPTSDKGIIINGTKWATRNVDAPGTFVKNPEDAGMFYQWNSKIGWSATDPMVNSNGGTLWVYPWNGGYSVSGSGQWDKINNPCPIGWRIPTRQELQSLADADSEWTTINGVKGRKFGSGANSLFLPAAGHRFTDGVLYAVGINGEYWSSTVYRTSSYEFVSSSGYVEVIAVDTKESVRAAGLSCRCVAE